MSVVVRMALKKVKISVRELIRPSDVELAANPELNFKIPRSKQHIIPISTTPVNF